MSLKLSNVEGADTVYSHVQDFSRTVITAFGSYEFCRSKSGWYVENFDGREWHRVSENEIGWILDYCRQELVEEKLEEKRMEIRSDVLSNTGNDPGFITLEKSVEEKIQEEVESIGKDQPLCEQILSVKDLLCQYQKNRNRLIAH